MRLTRALRDCKQRSLTVSKKAPTVSKEAPTVSKKAPPFFKNFLRHLLIVAQPPKGVHPLRQKASFHGELHKCGGLSPLRQGFCHALARGLLIKVGFQQSLACSLVAFCPRHCHWDYATKCKSNPLCNCPSCFYVHHVSYMSNYPGLRSTFSVQPLIPTPDSRELGQYVEVIADSTPSGRGILADNKQLVGNFPEDN